MKEFPSDLELTAASALLILSCEVELSSSTNSSMWIMEGLEFERELEKKSDALEFSYYETSTDDTTTLCNSSITTDDSVQGHDTKLVVTDDSRFHAIKLKVARKARTKVIYGTYIDQKPTPVRLEYPNPRKAVDCHVTTTTEGSCLSSGGSSEISSAVSKTRRRQVVEERKRRRVLEGDVRRRGVGSAHIRRRAMAIMGFLSAHGCASEIRIRQVIGDSPDTSKALRVLLKMEQVKRSGLGGRLDPYIYKIIDDQVAVETDNIAESFGR